MKWRPERISQMGRVVTGKTPSTKRQEFFDGDYLFITPSDLNYTHYYCREAERTVTEEAKAALSNQFIPADAVMFTCIGNTIGKCGIAPAECLTNQQINSVIPNYVHDSKFIYYLLCNNTDYIRHLGSGSATPIISKTKFEDVQLPAPTLDVQRRIGALLSAYDELMENNRRRMALLEEAARLLYQEWFVRLRFPGHEHTHIINGVPDGWEVHKVSEVVRRIPAGKLYSQETALPKGRVPILDQGKSGLIGFHDEEPSVIASTDEPVIVFANHTCYQRVVFYPFSAIQNVLPFISSPEMPKDLFWLHFATCGLIKTNAYKGHWPEFMAKEVLVPPKKITEMFGHYAKENLTLAYILELQNHKLRTARDLLLPKLMSGEIAV